MSKETMKWLRDNIRVGYTGTDGPAWWAASGEYMTDGSHFDGPVPVEEVERLLSVQFAEGTVMSEYRVPVLNGDGSPKVELVEEDGEPKFVPVTEMRVTTDPSRKTIITPDNGDILGIFKTGYQVHGYQQWTADQIAAILDTSKGELGVKSVGLLRKRGVAFLQAQLTGSGMEVGGFKFAPYILAATSVDGTLSSTYATGITAAVCDNTLAAALSGALTRLKVRHSKNSAGKLGDVRDKLGLVYQAADEFIAAATVLQSIEVTPRDFTAYLDEVAKVPLADPKSSTGGAKYSNAVKLRDKLTSLWTYDAKVAPWAGTAFGVLQLDNTMRTWHRSVSGADGGRLERNMLNMVNGVTAKEDETALAALAKVMGDRMALAA
jgi:phage/plasmid-like protein (TIGR03299 family)